MKKLFFLLGISILLFACSNDDDPISTNSSSVTDDALANKFINSDLAANIRDKEGNFGFFVNHVKNLGDDYVYEAWLVSDGVYTPIGTFMPAEKMNSHQDVFQVDPSLLENADYFVITIEPNPDDDPANPSNSRLVAGNMDDVWFFNWRRFTSNHQLAFNVDLADVAGKYTVMTTTSPVIQPSGLWFVESLGAGEYKAGLDLPNLPDGWKYESWIWLGGKYRSMGKFTSVSGSDENRRFYNGSLPDPIQFPGEDFLINAPTGLTFPLNLFKAQRYTYTDIIVTVEPHPDNNPDEPFFLQALWSIVPQYGVLSASYDMSSSPNLASLTYGFCYELSNNPW